MKQLLAEVQQRPITSRGDGIIAICGAGTLGGNLALALARRGFRRLRIIDRDWVDEQNLADEPYTPRDIGTPKARTLTRTLYDVGRAQAEALVMELTPDNASALLTGSDLVVDALDDPAGQMVVGLACSALHVPCLRLALDPCGSHGSLGWNGDEPFLETLSDRIVDTGCEAIVRFFLNGEKCAASRNHR